MAVALLPSPSRMKHPARRLYIAPDAVPEATVATLSYVDGHGQLATVGLTETEVWHIVRGLAWQMQGRPDRPCASYWPATAGERALLAKLDRIGG